MAAYRICSPCWLGFFNISGLRLFIHLVDDVRDALNDLADLGDAAFDKWDAEARAKGWMK